MADLGEKVVAAIYVITQILIKEHDGLDYILAFKHKETKTAYSGLIDPTIPIWSDPSVPEL